MENIPCTGTYWLFFSPFMKIQHAKVTVTVTGRCLGTYLKLDSFMYLMKKIKFILDPILNPYKLISLFFFVAEAVVKIFTWLMEAVKVKRVNHSMEDLTNIDFFI